jgi:uncharacterized coiled-coil protein SlyX
MTYEEMEKMVQFILEQQAQIVVQQQQVGERVSRLETNMADMARTQAHLNEVVAAMLETHKHTEEKLDAFIRVLERYISEGRNGNSDGNGSSQKQ